MKILYVAMKYDYGIPAQGLSVEHTNFFDSLNRCGHDILYFDFASLMQKTSRAAMNRRLAEVAKSEKHDLVFVFLAGDELDMEVISGISRQGNAPTVNWFADDHWRFEHYSRLWAPCFNYVVTTASSAVPKYEAMGYANAIKSQWAANHFMYRKLDLPLKYEATFVGQPHGDRRYQVKRLRDAGIDVRCWGSGWEQGRLTQEQMIEVFNQSKINLNFTNPSTAGGPRTLKVKARMALGRVTNFIPFVKRLKEERRRRIAAASENIAPKAPIGQPQIKGRNFEVPGCGGLMMSGLADDLWRYYDLEREMVCFDSTDDMIEKCKALLADETRRSAIAEAGYRRTVGEHTFAHRFDEIFRRMQLPTPPLTEVFAGKIAPGEVIEIT